MVERVCSLRVCGRIADLRRAFIPCRACAVGVSGCETMPGSLEASVLGQGLPGMGAVVVAVVLREYGRRPSQLPESGSVGTWQHGCGAKKHLLGAPKPFGGWKWDADWKGEHLGLGYQARACACGCARVRDVGLMTIKCHRGHFWGPGGRFSGTRGHCSRTDRLLWVEGGPRRTGQRRTEGPVWRSGWCAGDHIAWWERSGRLKVIWWYPWMLGKVPHGVPWSNYDLDREKLAPLRIPRRKRL